MAPDGRCKALDAAADGYVRAEAAVLVLLQAAAAADDTCTAHQAALLLCGTSVNQDGRSSSLTAPHGPSQQAVVLAAAAAAALAPAQLHAVEMHGTGEPPLAAACGGGAVQPMAHSRLRRLHLHHGTHVMRPWLPRPAGTALGDPIEVGALAAIVRRSAGAASAHPAVELAAAKSLLGHAETAAGVVGMLHAAGRLQQHQRAAVLHLHSLNTYVEGILDSAGGGFAAARQAAPGLLPPAGAMNAGCSAFAFQGTNAHALLRSQPAEGAAQQAACGSSARPWQRRRFWYTPAPHQMLLRAAVIGGGSSSSGGTSAAFEVALGRPALAFLWEHQVRAAWAVSAGLPGCSDAFSRKQWSQPGAPTPPLSRPFARRFKAACWCRQRPCLGLPSRPRSSCWMAARQ